MILFRIKAKEDNGKPSNEDLRESKIKESSKNLDICKWTTLMLKIIILIALAIAFTHFRLRASWQWVVSKLIRLNCIRQLFKISSSTIHNNIPIYLYPSFREWR